jgi:hypothetical protein
LAKSYYSTVFERSADAAWSVIRDFNNYPVWVEGAGESQIEAGKSDDCVGAVHGVLYDGNRASVEWLVNCESYSSEGQITSLPRLVCAVACVIAAAP